MDCAFPLLNKVVVTSSLDIAFKNSDFNFLVGSKAREPTHHSRKDIVIENSLAYKELAKAIGTNSSRNCHNLIMGFPPNTTCLICCHNAKGVPWENFSALSRLDHNRAYSVLAQKTESKIADISRVVVWGNPSHTIYPDVRNAVIGAKKVSDIVTEEWI